ncbi:hypothetical protein SADUNF_Sadunf06G0094400 [Salix dunnii]|uniref:Uncharacterized protein n=1 Tax=Salix dunnii TaxID=1413687 RepID=A0A835MWS3_9ROSI|nr:hypothetical protein SADUNF_Sadunf06G0094400 [Salix dunnii]
MKATEFYDAMNRVMELFGKPNLTGVPARCDVFVPSTIVFKLEKLVQCCRKMLVAGSETPSSTVEWAMAELLRHPKSMKNVKEELNRVAGPRQQR